MAGFQGVGFQVHAIVVGNDNGPTFTPSFQERDIPELFKEANSVYAPFGFPFMLASVEEVRSTLLNDDFTAAGEISIHNQNRDARQAKAIQYPGKLVIYFRDYHDLPNRDAFGFSGEDGDFVVMPKESSFNVQRLFAHELGHYLHLPHTWVQCELTSDQKSSMPIDDQIAELKKIIEQKIRIYVEVQGHSIEDGLDALNGDLPQVRDTPPDESGQLLEALNAKDMGKTRPEGGEACGSIASEKILVSFSDGRSKEYTLAPARDNIMSYFFGCSAIPMRITSDQEKLVNAALTTGNRAHLSLSPSDGPPPLKWGEWSDIPGGGDTDAAPAAAVLGNRIHVFLKGRTGLVFHNQAQAGQAFGQWSEVPGGGQTDAAPAAAALGNHLHVFVKGSTGLIFQNYAREGHPFGQWSEMPGGGRASAAPAAASLGKHLHVFVTSPTGQIFQNYAREGEPFGVWTEMPGAGETHAAPAATSFGDYLHVFVTSPTGQIFQNYAREGKPFGVWTEMPGSGRSNAAPAAAVFGNRLYVFVKGTGTRVFYSSAIYGRPFGPWRELPGDYATDAAPAAVGFPDAKRLYAFLKGPGGNVLHNSAGFI